MRQSVGTCGTPRAPLGRRFHHMVAAETQSITIARQASKRMIWFTSPHYCPMRTLIPYSARRSKIFKPDVTEHLARVLIDVDHPFVSNVIGIDRSGKDTFGAIGHGHGITGHNAKVPAPFDENIKRLRRPV